MPCCITLEPHALSKSCIHGTHAPERRETCLAVVSPVPATLLITPPTSTDTKSCKKYGPTPLAALTGRGTFLQTQECGLIASYHRRLRYARAFLATCVYIKCSIACKGVETQDGEACSHLHRLRTRNLHKTHWELQQWRCRNCGHLQGECSLSVTSFFFRYRVSVTQILNTSSTVPWW